MSEDKSADYTVKKKVDESWKASVQQEKKPDSFQESQETVEIPEVPEAGFSFLVSTLGMQAWAALGEIPNPADGQKKVDHGQARYLIDTLRMLSEKTKGNLTKEEATMIRELLYDLEMKFVEKSRPQ